MLDSNQPRSSHKKKRSNSTPSNFLMGLNQNQYRISTWAVRSKRQSNLNNANTKPQRNVFPTRHNSLYTKPNEYSIYNAEITQFQSIIQNINQQLRDLYLSNEFIDQLNDSLNNIKTVGINQLKSNKKDVKSSKSRNKSKKVENVEFSQVWNDFISDIQQNIIETPTKNQFSSYIESSIGLLKKDFDTISRFPPQNSSFKKQWNDQYQLFQDKFEEINQIVSSEDVDLSLLGENFEGFLNKLNETYLFRRTSLAMAKRDALQLSIKQNIVNILKYKDQIMNDQNAQNIFKFITKINSYIAQLEQIFSDTEENLVLNYLKTENQIEPETANEREINIDDKQIDEEEEEEKTEQQINPVPQQLKSARNYNKLFTKKLEVALREEEALTKEVAEKEELINSTKDLLKKLSIDPKESAAVQRRNDAKKKKESIEKNVNSLKSEIKKIEKQLELKTEEYNELQNVKKELHEAQIENEYQKSLKSINSKYFKRLNMYANMGTQEKPSKSQGTKIRESKSLFLPSSKAPANIVLDDMTKKLQSEMANVKNDYESLLKERSLNNDKALYLMYYDAQRIKQQNIELKEELQELQLQNISLGKERDINKYLKATIQSKKKELREINVTEPFKLKANGYALNNDLLAERSEFDANNQSENENDVRHILKRHADSLMKIRLTTKKQIEKQNEVIKKYNETMKNFSEAELGLMIQKRRLEQLHIDFDYDLFQQNEKISKMRELIQQKVETEEKLRNIEYVFNSTFGDRIPYHSKMNILEQIDFVAKQFHKSK